MSKIFLSHSKLNNAHALAVAQWLKENGWAEYFLDVEAARGPAPGERWQETLRLAAHRCEAVLFLISPGWLDAPWCQAEFLLAKQLRKTIFGVLVEVTPLDKLPREMTAEWQMCDLANGAERRSFRVSHDPLVPETEVSLAVAGLARLKIGLQRSGVDPSSFSWPPPNDPQRAPYRGLKALEAEDAAVFFGREAALVRGLDTLRAMREHRVERMLVILGASGSGKSSFLRAGLWPRLARDDLHFLPLPVLRPERAVLSGPTGLVASLQGAFREHQVAETRAAIRTELQVRGGFARLLVRLQELARSRLDVEARTPTIVISIDQGEELASAEGRKEAEAFLSMLAESLRPSQEIRGARTCLLSLALIAIRSDSYERLQTERSLEGIPSGLLSLEPIPRAEFKTVIERPAARASAAGHTLAVEPALTERLLKDAEGVDALPLLAFTLERLYVEHGGRGDLRLNEYEALGGVRGSIEAAVEAAFAEPGHDPAVPASKHEREALLRKAFVPWLAGVDPDTEERKRRVARWHELPRDTHPLLERLIAVRLLSRARRKLEGSDEEVVTIEVAHEALLRQWPTLTTWLDADADALKALDAGRRAAAEWLKNERGDAWLVHTGERLVNAQQLRRRGDFDRLLGADGAAYLDACRKRDDAARQEREVQLERVARAQRRVRVLLATIAIVFAGAAIFGWHQAGVAKEGRTQALIAQSKALSEVSRQQTDKGYATLGTLLALEALPQSGKDRPFVASAEAALLAALFVQHERHILSGHADAINQVRFSPRGSLLATASRDGTVRIWDPTTGKTTVALAGHSGQVYGVEFSPDGNQVVTASSDKTARVWMIASGQTIAILGGHEGEVVQASFSSDGRQAVTASGDATARVWDASTGQVLAILRGHEGPIWSARFSPDGERVVTTSEDQTSRLWGVKTGNLLATLRGHADRVLDAAFSSDGRRILTTSWDHTGRLWDGVTGRVLGVLKGHQDGINRGSFSPDGKRVVTAAADGTARLWDGLTGRSIAVLQGHRGQVHDARFSSDGRWLVTTGDDGTARLWDSTTRQPAATFRGHSGRVWSASFSPDGHYLATASEDDTARIWNVAPSRIVTKLMTHKGRVHRASFSPDGHQLVTVSDDRTARLWSSESGDEIGVLSGHESGIWYCTFFGNGRYVLTTSADGTARLWEVATRRLVHTLRGHEGLVTHADFSPDGGQVATAGMEGTARVWDIASGESKAVLRGHSGPVNFVAFSPDGQRIATASQDGTARLWKAATHQLIAVLEGHAGPVINGAFSTDGTRLVTASWDRTARLWDGVSGKALSTLHGHTDAILSASFSRDGRLVVTGSSDNTARVWSAASGEPLIVLQAHAGEVYEASFSSDGRLVLTASQDGTARLWHAASGLPVARLDGHGGPVVSAAFSPNGYQLATGSWDGTAILWKLPVTVQDDWPRYARETVPRTLTGDERRLYLEE